ncbi:Olfactory receptor 14I1 [Fukomys damarensis]|uniref:Olfactory receptor 14I1 n=1 Tax=Fukomys damarensis TaxID=885580 RepID=A0A091DZL2_FUKDA|nr:Olfactory receptor 14I1 [Fukomys damarensis]
MDNLTIFTKFLLVDVTGSRELQVLQGVLFLVIYLGALTGNLLTVTVIVTDTRLHSPMYFFISNVALLDLGSISVVVPKAVMNSMTGRKTISLTECAAQIFLYTLFVVVEFALLVVMSYDRYVAICHPLHYGLIITPSLCSQATAGSWASSLAFSAVHTGALFRLPFTKTNVIQQYFCDIPQVLRISSSDVQFSEFKLEIATVRFAAVIYTESQHQPHEVALDFRFTFCAQRILEKSGEHGRWADMDNLTIFTEFLLMDVTASQELQVLQAVLFLVIYLGALTGNLVTVTVIVTDTRLHSPMYFFISNVALLDLGSISVVVPKAVVNSMTGRKTISLTECAAQIFLFSVFAAVEIALLVVMSYDRYVAICHPLHYGLIITPGLCSQATAGSWASGLVYSAVHTGALFRLPFTKTNVIQQYFCDVPQILRISSLDVQFYEFVLITVSVSIVLIGFIFMLISYINIFSTVLKIDSKKVRNKALSTCTPQLAILHLFLISEVVAALGPTAKKPSLKNLLTAMFYTMVPPFVNLLIYCLRNREISAALRRMFNRYSLFPVRGFLK